MKIQDITSLLEKMAPPSLQESYDNAGLLTGNAAMECTGVLVSLDATEAVIDEAIAKGCNMVVAHHPIIFKGLKKITGRNYVEQSIIKAIKNDIAIYAIHTNLDNVMSGVNGRIADKLGLKNRKILLPKEDMLRKLAVFVPAAHREQLAEVLFAAGAGNIGNYSDCGFSTEGTGSFKGNNDTNPFVGKPGERHHEAEAKLEVIFPVWLERPVLSAMRKAHPYEEIAFDIYSLANSHEQTGSGLVGEIEQEMSEKDFLGLLKEIFNLSVIRHTGFTGKQVKKVALCGGAGSFLTGAAKAAGAQVYVSSDIKYHEFFDAEGVLMLADIGHYESEQFTTDLLLEVLRENFPTFALLKSGVQTNPVHYFL
ncbi:MAG: Nif3-like dinuclear metal center hexameric protein [Bacteroidetes bacterium]|nr:Nif3-like dinuclear metal center hexameric protein [Bacteroidota bacterium]